MTDKVQKIRAEIERRYNEYMAKDSELAAIRADECLGLLSYIDSMQEEANTKEYLCIKDFYPYKKGKVYKSIGGGFPANAKEYFTLVEKSVSEELEEAAERLSTIFAGEGSVDPKREGFAFYVGFKNGANWQKKQMMAKAITAHCFGFQGDALLSFRLPTRDNLVGSEVKVIVIKED